MTHFCLIDIVVIQQKCDCLSPGFNFTIKWQNIVNKLKKISSSHELHPNVS